MFNIDVESVVENWLIENRDDILENISRTIERWLDENKQEIYDIIREKSNV
jgi:hypothetical protein